MAASKRLQRGKDLLEKLPLHPRSSLCPICKKDIERVGLTHLVYAFEPCECAIAAYTHLVETIYHIPCFVASPLLKQR